MLVYLLTEHDEGELLYRSHFVISTARARRPGATSYQGVPFLLNPDKRTLAGMYVIVAREYAAKRENEQAAWALYNQLKRRAARTTPYALFGELLEELGTYDVHRSRADQWSLMFFLWVAGMRPSSYLAGEANLGTAFFQDLYDQPGVPLALDERGRARHADVMRTLFGHFSELVAPRMPGLPVMFPVLNTVADSELVGRMIEQAESLQLRMFAAELGSKAMAKAMFNLATMLPCVTEYVVLDVALQAITAYIDLAEAMKEAEGQELDEEQVKGIFFPVFGVLLPLAARNRFLAPLVGSAVVAVVALKVFQLMWYAVAEMLDAAERLVDAIEAKFIDYEEADLGMGFFIPTAEEA